MKEVRDSNEVYTTLDADDAGGTGGGIVSGGTEGDATIVGGLRFLWVYNPYNTNTSGFTGTGWYEDIEGSPINYYTKTYNTTLQNILNEFEANQRFHLNDIFSAWQSYVNAQQQLNNDVLKKFQMTITNSDCWTFLK